MTTIIKSQKEAEEMVKNGILKVYDDLKITCDIKLDADIYAHDIDAENINAHNIGAHNIKAYDIYARNIDALNIDADDINFYKYCIANKSLKCENAVARRDNYVLECLDSDIKYKEDCEHKFRCDFCGEVQYKNHEHKFRCDFCGEVQECKEPLKENWICNGRVAYTKEQVESAVEFLKQKIRERSVRHTTTKAEDTVDNINVVEIEAREIFAMIDEAFEDVVER